MQLSAIIFHTVPHRAEWCYRTEPQLANTTPRRLAAKPAPKPSKALQQEAPWSRGNPERKISINVPFPEPLMIQLDYLVENRAIHSKSSFIRDVVDAAAMLEVEKLRRVQEAVRRIEAEDRAKK
ncbi:hypothetical protein [Paraburkholderia hospita]|uniref:hypothetical protein n=1 Tax=Paraburkholderia hospita TaxID=169430 RepID=UPI0008A7B675|nr:hypothetical protein [Paraburkholderia hospita]SEH89967.1 hypothetical protein SAMN05192544_1011161 [Paraburkholderia hospita]